ncbi:MAG TPA: hypothetical protein VF273_11915 [Pelobium sp.]
MNRGISKEQTDLSYRRDDGGSKSKNQSTAKNSALASAATKNQSKSRTFVAKGAAESFCYFLRKKVKERKGSSGQRPKKSARLSP